MKVLKFIGLFSILFNVGACADKQTVQEEIEISGIDWANFELPEGFMTTHIDLEEMPIVEVVDVFAAEFFEEGEVMGEEMIDDPIQFKITPSELVVNPLGAQSNVKYEDHGKYNTKQNLKEELLRIVSELKPSADQFLDVRVDRGVDNSCVYAHIYARLIK